MIQTHPSDQPSPGGAATRKHAGVDDRDALFAEFAPLVRRLIMKYGSDPELRQDLAGEIYCRFCHLLDAFDPTRGVPLRPYLVRQLTATTYTFARERWRQQKRELVTDPDEGFGTREPSADPTPTWLSAISWQEVGVSLRGALDDLPIRQRNVVVWRYVENRSFEEIAQRLEIQPVSARSLLRHGLNSLRRTVSSELALTA